MAARLIELPTHSDYRGNLTVIEDVLLPFRVRRRFCIWKVPCGEERGDHANRICHQFLWAVNGEVMARADGESFYLGRPRYGLYVEPMTWLVIEFANSATRLMVLASHPYDPEDHITDYGEFLKEKGEKNSESSG